MLLSPAQEATLARKLGPAVSSAGLSTKIIGHDSNWGNTAYALALMGDSAAAPYLDGTAFHCYSGDPSQQSQVKSAYPTKNVYSTECSGGQWSTDFGSNEWWDVHNLVIGVTRNWAKTVVKWNLALDQNGGPTNGGCGNCRGVVTINSTTGEAAYNVEYYALGHASKFVRPGAYRIASSTYGAGNVETVAFRNMDGSKAVIVLNGSGKSQTLNVVWKGFTTSLPSGVAATYAW